MRSAGSCVGQRITYSAYQLFLPWEQLSVRAKLLRDSIPYSRGLVDTQGDGWHGLVGVGLLPHQVAAPNLKKLQVHDVLQC